MDQLTDGRREMPPIPIEPSVLRAHFGRAIALMRARFLDVPGVNPTIRGDLKEEAVREFLSAHVPGMVGVGAGHVLYEDRTSRQQDVVVFRREALVLPVGSAGFFDSEGVLACIEVKSTLSKSVFVDEVLPNIASLAPKRPLCVLVAGKLANSASSRGVVRRWIDESAIPINLIPDVILLLNAGTIVRRAALRTLMNVEHNIPGSFPLLKYGKFDTEAWAGLALLAFEIASLASHVGWAKHNGQILPTLLTELTVPGHQQK
jgi:hypothetical protein